MHARGRGGGDEDEQADSSGHDDNDAGRYAELLGLPARCAQWVKESTRAGAASEMRAMLDDVDDACSSSCSLLQATEPAPEWALDAVLHASTLSVCNADCHARLITTRCRKATRDEV